MGVRGDVERGPQGLLNPAIYIVAHKEISIDVAQAAQEAMDLKIAAVQSKLLSQKRPIKPGEMAEINFLADQAIALYNHFLRCYNLLGEEEAPSSSSATSRSFAAPSCLRDGRVILSTVGQGSLVSVIGSFIATLQVRLQGEEDEVKRTGGYAGGDPSKPLDGATRLDQQSVEAYLTAHFCIARLLGKRIEPVQRERDVVEALRRFEWIIANAPALLADGEPGVFERELALCREMATLLPEKLHRMRNLGESFGML
jgi:hypothetical protein